MAAHMLWRRQLLLSLVLLLLTAAAAPAATAVGAAPGAAPWARCVADIHSYFRPSNGGFEWLPNPCGFRTLQPSDIRAAAFRRTDATFHFSGDSTALRAYVWAANALLELQPPIVAGRVAQSPEFVQQSRPMRVPAGVTSDADVDSNASATPTAPNATADIEIRFSRLQYLSTGAAAVRDAVATARGGVLFLTFGNWDLNWQVQLNMPMPGLVGGVRNYTAAQEYWARYAQETAEALAAVLSQTPLDRRPIVVVREQFLPNCDAARFASKKRRYRRCAPFVRPTVVPLYRRVLAPLLWGQHVPVVSVDALFADGYRHCGISDGLHLDPPCMAVEQQLLWNAYLAVRRMGVRRLQGTVAGGGEARLPRAVAFLQPAAYLRWHARFFGRPAGPAAAAAVGAVGAAALPLPADSGSRSGVADAPNGPAAIPPTTTTNAPSTPAVALADPSAGAAEASAAPPPRARRGTALLTRVALALGGDNLWTLVCVLLLSAAALGTWAMLSTDEPATQTRRPPAATLS